MNGEPKRISALNSFSKCSGLVAARTLTPGTSGKAADTGTAVGRGIELWHKGSDYTALLRKLREEHEEHYPLADLAEVERVVLAYCNDLRNRPDVVLPDSLELEVTLRLDADQDDPTGEPIVLTGHVDQVRYAFPDHKDREHLGLELWDVKNGRGSGEDMTRDYAFQLAAYTLALEEHYGEGEIAMGGVVRTKGYIARGNPEPSEARVFFPMPWRKSDCLSVLDTVRYLIGQIRAGAIPHTPGPHCRYCPLEFPHCAGGGLEKLILDS